VIDFFRDQLRIQKEMDQQTGGASRLISGWNLGSGGKIQIGEQSSGLLGEMALIDAQFMSEDKRMEYLQDRIKRAEEQRVREGKARVDRKEEEGRIQRRADMWIDGAANRNGIPHCTGHCQYLFILPP
jgi:hypothetical protein